MEEENDWWYGGEYLFEEGQTDRLLGLSFF